MLSRNPSRWRRISFARQRAYWTVIGVASLACGGIANAQTTNTPAPAAASDTGSATNVTTLAPTTVIGQMDQSRNQITPELGATFYTVSKAQIEAQAQGENAQFNQELLRIPGVAEDSLGQVHVRGEHANLQYRINDVLLPEGITGFGPELSPRFADTFRLITGSLPAQYGFRTAGIVDIHTKSGAFDQGGDVSMYGGTYDTLNPSFEFGGSSGNWNYYFDGSYLHDGIGIENPTDSAIPIHDDTDQYKLFGYVSRILDDTSRISGLMGASFADFEVPNTPSLPPGTNPNTGSAWNDPTVNSGNTLPGSFNSSDLNERQNEQNYYIVVAYQKTVGDMNMQLSLYGRESSVHFRPDQIGDLYFNGVASDDNRHLYSGGLQADFSYELNDSHTLRWGASYLGELASDDSSTRVFATDPITQEATGAPFSIDQSETTHGSFYGFYLQDEWKLTHKLTINYGARFDVFSSYIDQNQISPRVNAIYDLFTSTTLHGGYARYFTPPPLEIVSQGSVQRFDNTSNASDVPGDRNDPVQSERSHYFDAGITQKIIPGLQVGVDGYYKKAEHQLDDGLFGQTLILSPFNYRYGTIEGVEFTVTYAKEGFSTFGNVAVSKAVGKEIESAQSVVGESTVAYSQNNSVYLDHNQTVTASAGASYRWKETDRNSTLFYTDALYGSGLREDATDNSGNLVPNGGTVPAYYEINIGAEQDFKLGGKQHLKARLDVVNLLDRKYELRNGSGVGVNAAQFGERRGVFGSLTYVF